MVEDKIKVCCPLLKGPILPRNRRKVERTVENDGGGGSKCMRV